MRRFILLFTFLIPVSLCSQEHQELKESTVLKYKQRDNDAFWYADLPLGKDKSKHRVVERSMEQSKAVEQIIRAFFWILIAVALVGICIFIFKNILAAPDKRLTAAASVSSEIETKEDLEIVDYAALIEEAKNAGNYSLALRWRYLSLLKELSVRDKIVFKSYHTNREYYLQLEKLLGIGSPFLQSFNACTASYERSWFGKYAITPEGLLEAENKFAQAFSEL